MSDARTASCRIKRNTWAGARLARFGYLVGLGLDAKTIASKLGAPERGKPMTASNVGRQCVRFGLSLRDARKARPVCNGRAIPEIAMRRLKAAADARGCPIDDLIHRVIVEAGSHDGLVDNILDDLS